VDRCALPVVIKADGLAAGKGVVIAETPEVARATVREFLEARKFGDASASIVIEEFLDGEEASYFVLADGRELHDFATAQDHKRLLDGDAGPNTGGMGAYSPASNLSPGDLAAIRRQVVEPLNRVLIEEGLHYRGVLFIGLMMTAAGPRVLEFNTRFGDPETQAMLWRLKSDFVELVEAVVCGGDVAKMIEFHDDPAVCVVAAAAGYPERARTGAVIHGLDSTIEGVRVYHAGTGRNDVGEVVVNGGRVLGVTARGKSLRVAVDRAYERLAGLEFDGMQYRRDIGFRGLGH
jgi:phosphoribosylamine--glycine ligase